MEPKLSVWTLGALRYHLLQLFVSRIQTADHQYPIFRYCTIRAVNVSLKYGISHAFQVSTLVSETFSCAQSQHNPLPVHRVNRVLIY